MIVRCLAAAALAFLVAYPAQAEESAVEVSIAKVLKTPGTYHGKLVRVRGVLNECISMTCMLCPSAPGKLPTDTKACFGVEFEPVVEASKLEGLYRFAEITAEGRYDATCDPQGRADPYSEQNQTMVVCTDRATDFMMTRVIDVHKRWPATQGFLTEYRGWQLTMASTEEAKAVIVSYNALQLYDSDMIQRHDDEAYKVFRVTREDNEPVIPETNPLPSRDEAVLCKCIDDSCAGKWPKLTGHLYPTVANPYRCAAAVRVGKDWRFLPEMN